MLDLFERLADKEQVSRHVFKIVVFVVLAVGHLDGDDDVLVGDHLHDLNRLG